MKKMLLFVFLMITSIGWGQQIEPYKFTSVVDLYEFPSIGTTGMVDVDLPLYTINTKGFELPLTLRYDQMGNTNVFYKGNQFGDAWVLNALGTISRETKVQSVSTPATSLLIICGDQKVMGSAPAFRILESPKVPDEIYYLSNPTVRYRDTNKADVFTFSILGLSGKFRLYNDSGALKAEILESTDFVNIQIVTPAVGENIGSIILRDKNGFRYEFSTPSNINNNYYTHTTYLDTTLTLEDSCYLTSGDPSETPAIAPVGGSTILFNGTLISRAILNDHAKFWENLEITKIYDKADNLLLEFEYDLVQFLEPDYANEWVNGVGMFQPYQKQFVKKINIIGQGSVNFNNTINTGINNVVNSFTNSLEVKDLKNNLIEKINFGYLVKSIHHLSHIQDYKNGSNGLSFNKRLLTQVNRIASAGQGHLSTTLEYKDANITKENTVVDRYGFLTKVGYCMLHLSKNDYKADAFILQKIKYPTGGSVIYQFEPNTFSNGAYSNNFKDFNYDNHIYEELALTTSGNQATFSANEGDTIFVLNTLSTPSLRLYKKYGVASVLVRSSFKNKVGDFKLSENHCKHHLTNLVLPASTQNEYELDYSSNILPGSVKVYRFGYATPTNNFRYAEGNRISKIAYFENNVPKNILETPNGEDLAEKVITIDYSDPEGVNSSSGKTRSNYESDPLLKSVGLLYDKVNFQIKGVGSRLLDYGIPHLGGWSRSISTDVKNSKTFDINNQILSEVNNEYVYKKYVNDTHPFSYGGLKPYIYTSTSTSKLYEGLDFKQTSTFMVLDTIYKQPMLTESTDALGKTIKTEYDYATIGDVIVNTQIRNYINGNQSETILNSYDLLANPMKAEFKTPQMGAYEILGAVNKYDGHGNLIHSITPDGLSTCFIWGYNKTRLVAKLVNISYEDFLANPNVQNIIIHINTHSNQAGLNYDEVLLKLYLDGLKFAAPNAMVTTYTYKPMVGISTITDENGKVTTYEYDTFNRLRRITDHEGNILKEYQYNFTN